MPEGKDLFSFQAIKVCTLIYLIAFYFLGKGILWKIYADKFSLTLRWGDVGMAVCTLWWLVEWGRCWRVVEQGSVWECVATLGLYAVIRMEGEKVNKWILGILPFLVLWQFLQYQNGRMPFFNSGIWGCFLACVCVVAGGYALGGKNQWLKIGGLSVCLFLLCIALYCPFSGSMVRRSLWSIGSWMDAFKAGKTLEVVGISCFCNYAVSCCCFFNGG